jgi:hypothetical protein
MAFVMSPAAARAAAGGVPPMETSRVSPDSFGTVIR